MLGGSTLFDYGSSYLNGNIGTSPGSTITNFPPANCIGTINRNNASSAAALTDFTNAATAANNISTFVSTLPSAMGGNQVLIPGTYRVSNASITGTLILSGAGQYVFQVTGTLTTAATSTIILVGGALASQVFWVVSGTVLIGTGTYFSGNIISTSSTTVSSGASAIGNVPANTQYTVLAAASASFSGSISATASASIIVFDTVVVTISNVCYAKGTKILTRYGYKAIEDISMGEELCVKGNIENKSIVSSGDYEKVTWGGNFTLYSLNKVNRPIVFKANSIGMNIPSEEVRVSPGHGVVVNNVIVPASSLINNDTIYQDMDCETVTYYHLETENHSVLNASGLLGESLLGCHEYFSPIEGCEHNIEEEIRNVKADLIRA
jgi:hypothetical protein